MGKFRKRKDEARTEPANQVTESKTETASVIEEKPAEDDPATSKFAEHGDAVEAAGGEIAPQPDAVTTNKRGVIPDQFGNNVKGERICSVCGIKESETLAKNPRYSFCKGKCVNCYGKTERKTAKPEDMTVEQIEAKIKHYTDLLAKKTAELNGAQGLPEGDAIVNANETMSNDPAVHLVAPSDNEELAEITQ